MEKYQMLKSIVLAGVVLAISGGVALADDGIFPQPSPDGWGGFYMGLNGVYAKGKATDRGVTFPDISLMGDMVGGQTGYNFVLVDGVVAGIQTDLDWSAEQGSYGDGTTTVIGTFNTATLTDKINWTGAATAHVGVYVGPVMAYALGGITVAGNTLHNLGTDQLQGHSPIEAEVDQTQVGWTAGGGVAAKVGPFSGFLEYRYSDYGTGNYNAAVGAEPVRVTDQQVRVGLNYYKQ